MKYIIHERSAQHIFNYSCEGEARTSSRGDTWQLTPEGRVCGPVTGRFFPDNECPPLSPVHQVLDKCSLYKPVAGIVGPAHLKKSKECCIYMCFVITCSFSIFSSMTYCISLRIRYSRYRYCRTSGCILVVVVLAVRRRSGHLDITCCQRYFCVEKFSVIQYLVSPLVCAAPKELVYVLKSFLLIIIYLNIYLVLGNS